MNTNTKLSKQRLRAVRKLMRSGPVTQADICRHLDISQGVASMLLQALIEANQVRVSHKEKNAIGRRAVLVYALTESYLATVKPELPDAEEEPASRQYEITYIPSPPSLLQRLKAWLFGKPASVAA